MIPMPGKIIVKQDGGSEQRGRVLVSQRFAEKDRPMTGRVLAVGVGKPVRLEELEIERRVRQNAIGFVDSPEGDDLMCAAVISIIRTAMEEERQSRPVSVKAGDRVVFRVFAGDGIEWTDGSMCRCLTEDDVLAKIEE